jgi:hypothetical protein
VFDKVSSFFLPYNHKKIADENIIISKHTHIANIPKPSIDKDVKTITGAMTCLYTLIGKITAGFDIP